MSYKRRIFHMSCLIDNGVTQEHFEEWKYGIRKEMLFNNNLPFYEFHENMESINKLNDKFLADLAYHKELDSELEHQNQTAEEPPELPF